MTTEPRPISFIQVALPAARGMATQYAYIVRQRIEWVIPGPSGTATCTVYTGGMSDGITIAEPAASFVRRCQEGPLFDPPSER